MLIIGNYASPYVRKVLVALDIVGASYDIDPIIPFYGNDAFTELSPLRRIPVLIDGDLTLCDSTVIVEYLADRFPAARLLPDDPVGRARARWFEEYCDSRLGDVIVWKLFFQRCIRPGVWLKATDEAIVAEAIEQDLPVIMDWIEAQAPQDAFLFGAPTQADIALGAFMRNAAFANWQPDPARWPRAAAWINRIMALPSFGRLLPYEQLTLRTPPAVQRDALRDAGAPVSDISYAATEKRAGIMPLAGQSPTKAVEG